MGMIILIIFVIYLLVGFFLSKLIYKIFQKKLISRLFLTFFIVFPFWDVLLQEATAIYYKNMFEKTKVYSKAELDKNGKVDSIAFLTYAADINKYSIKKFNNHPHAFDSITKYKEYLVIDSNGKEKILKVKKLAESQYSFELLEQPTARYRVVKEEVTKTFLHNFGYKKIIDTKKNKILAESFYLHFNKFNNDFRTDILYMVSGNGISIFKRPNIRTLPTTNLLNNIGIE